MKTITFECEIITPMFLAGANGKTPELRPPSIKGAMRFWWRAMNAGNYQQLKDLKETECKIFGGSDESSGRSKVIIWVSKQPKYNESTDKNFLLPHKEGNRRGEMPCFMPASKFIVNLQTLQLEHLQENEIIKLFQTVSKLGGLGKGSRRGYGSFKITNIKINGTEINKPNLELDELIIRRSELKYPYIKNVQISKSPKTIIQIREISSKIHSNDYSQALRKSRENGNIQKDKSGKEQPNKNYLEYPRSIGDGSNRFASPIYVSIIEKEDGKHYAVVTTLNTVPPKNETYDEKIQNEFINNLLL